MVNSIFNNRPEGRRKIERATMKWLEELEKYLRTLKVKRSRKKAMNRIEWASVVKKVKALRGKYYHYLFNKLISPILI